jgi:hypothetical protein
MVKEIEYKDKKYFQCEVVGFLLQKIKGGDLE